ncbi:GTPase Era [Nannocystaceae bacterium ST9]
MAEQTNSQSTPPSFKAGFVALCGRPNVGKSTLLNALLGETLAVATALPQTTRERMLGVWTTDHFQAVLVDTPGIHRPKSALNRFMVDEAVRGAADVDVILMLAEVPRLPSGPEGVEAAAAWQVGPGAKQALELLIPLGRPMVLVLTKADLIGDRELLLPLIERWQALHSFAAVIPISATQQRGLEGLRDELERLLPEGQPFFQRDQLSDKSMRWHASELIRGVLFEQLGQELPYSSAVTIRSYEEGSKGDRIEASIHVERDSQKGIVIGAKGKMIKAISMSAREKIAKLTGRPCALFLEVRVDSDWTRDPRKLERLGYAERDAAVIEVSLNPDEPTKDPT